MLFTKSTLVLLSFILYPQINIVSVNYLLIVENTVKIKQK